MRKMVVYAALLAAVLMVSCDKRDPSYNFAQIMYPGYNDAVLFADQTSDSLKFATSYDWNLTCASDWVTIPSDGMSGHLNPGYYEVRRVMLSFDVNTDTLSRTAIVSFNADGKSLLSVYHQLHYLNVKRPYRSEEAFLQTDSATQLRDSLVFTTYGDDWTLTFKEGEDASWLHFAPEAVTGGTAGSYTVAYTLDEHTGDEPRNTVLQLKSRGVVTEIEIRQLASKGV